MGWNVFFCIPLCGNGDKGERGRVWKSVGKGGVVVVLFFFVCVPRCALVCLFVFRNSKDSSRQMRLVRERVKPHPVVRS